MSKHKIMDTKFWIRQDRLDNEIEFVDYALAETLLLNARTTLLSESLSIDYWLTNFLYIDLIRIGKKKEASTLKVLKTIKENNFFHLSELRATTSKESIDELLKILPNHTDYGAAIIAERFIDEGKTNELLTALEFSKISFQAQKEILFAINRTENNYSRLTEYYQLAINAKEYDGTLFGMNYKIGNQIEKGEITLSQGLSTLDGYNISNASYSKLATSSALSGNMEMYSKALSYLVDDYSRTTNIVVFINTGYLSLPNQSKENFIQLLEGQKQTKEISMYLTLLKDFLIKEPTKSNSLVEFCKNHKRFQPEDIVSSYLIKNGSYKECIEFIDNTQGVNRFGQYLACLKALLVIGDIEYVVEKTKTIKDNSTRSSIIEKLLELNQLDVAMNLNKTALTSKTRKEWTDKHFMKYYVRKDMVKKAIILIEKHKNPVSRVGFYHQLGRMCMGMKYGSTG
jgi:hypothetical protein